MFFFEENQNAESGDKVADSRESSPSPRQTSKAGDKRARRTSRPLPQQPGLDLKQGLTRRWGLRLLSKVGLEGFQMTLSVFCLVFSILVSLNSANAQTDPTNPLSTFAAALSIGDMIHQQFRKLRPKDPRVKRQIFQLHVSFQLSEIQLFQQTRNKLLQL